MSITDSTLFGLYYCQTALPATFHTGGLYIYNGGIYLATGTTTVERLDGVTSGATNPSTAVSGEYFYNTTNHGLFVYDGSAWQRIQAANLSSDVTFTLSGASGSGTLTAGTNAATITVSSVPATLIAAGELADGMTAVTQDAGDNSDNLATTAYVDSAGFSSTITGDGNTASFVVTHDLGTKDIMVEVLCTTDNLCVPVLVNAFRTTDDTLTLNFGSAPDSGETFRVLCRRV